MNPKDYFYTKEHEWIKIEGDEAVMGVTDFAQKQLGDIIYVELPEVGRQIESHAKIGVIESVKSVSDVFSPVSGKVAAVNQSLGQAADAVNKDPYGQGWILRIKMADKSQVAGLMAAADYEKYLEGLES
jgi:glycine cleavage system H protein